MYNNLFFLYNRNFKGFMYIIMFIIVTPVVWSHSQYLYIISIVGRNQPLTNSYTQFPYAFTP